jgi:hypothetical protein
MALSDKIVQTGLSYVGQQEISGNKGFKNAAFQKKMEECGWSMTQSWCAYFAELVWKEAFGKSHPLWKTLDRLFSPSATATFANFKGHPTEFATGKTPKVGALVVWQYGNGWQGHIGVVTELVDKTTFKTVEGNTNSSGGREGIEVAVKTRKLGEPFKAKGLNIVGFVYPPEA